MPISGADGRVTVVMITHNRCEEVVRSVGHLVRLPERPHIILVDNGSCDGTAYAVGRRFPEVEIVNAGRNLGAAGRNLGVRCAKTAYVALCDDDAWWAPGSLSRAADVLDVHPKLGVLTARILVGHDEHEADISAELERSPLPTPAGMPGRPLLGFLAGASVVRRSAFLDAGGFPEHAFIGGEEALLAVDLAARGWWLCYAPELVVHHYPSPRRDIASRQAHVVRNALWFAWLRRPLTSALRRSFATIRRLPRDRASRRGFAAAMAGLPWILRQRRVVPPEVERGLRLLENGHRPCSADVEP